MTPTLRRTATIALLVCAPFVVAASAGWAERSRPAGAATCALQLPNRLVNANSLASTRLVPPGADSLSLCRYAGLKAGRNTGRLAASATSSTAATIARLTREFDTLPRQSAGLHCPFDDGAAL
jgi:hypothetical protein